MDAAWPRWNVGPCRGAHDREERRECRGEGETPQDAGNPCGPTTPSAKAARAGWGRAPSGKLRSGTSAASIVGWIGSRWSAMPSDLRSDDHGRREGPAAEETRLLALEEKVTQLAARLDQMEQRLSG